MSNTRKLKKLGMPFCLIDSFATEHLHIQFVLKTFKCNLYLYFSP